MRRCPIHESLNKANLIFKFNQLNFFFFFLNTFMYPVSCFLLNGVENHPSDSRSCCWWRRLTEIVCLSQAAAHLTRQSHFLPLPHKDLLASLSHLKENYPELLFFFPDKLLSWVPVQWNVHQINSIATLIPKIQDVFFLAVPRPRSEQSK